MTEENRDKSFAESVLEGVEAATPEAPVVEEPVVKEPEAPVVKEPVVETPAVPSGPPEELFEEAKPPEAAMEEELKEIEGNEGIANLRTAYKNLKNELKQAQDKALSLEGTLQESKDAGGDAEKLRTRMEAMSNELERVALERHPEFRQRFEAREQALDTMGNDLVGEAATEELPKEELMRLIKEPQSPYKTQRLNALAEQVTPYLYSQLVNLSNHYAEIGAEKQSLLANHKETLEALQAKEQRSRQELITGQRVAFDNTLSAASQNLEFLREVEGNDTWNASVKGIKDQARAIYFEESDPENLMRAAVLAATAEPYRQAYLSARQSLREALAELKDFKGANPSIPEGGAPAALPSGPGEEEDFGDFVGRAVAAAHE